MFSGLTGIMNRGEKIKGSVVLMRKNLLDFNTIASIPSGGVEGVIGSGLNVLGSTLDGLTAFLGRSVSIQLISATQVDENGNGKVGKDTFLEGIIASLPTLGAGESAFSIHFEWDNSMGIPGAFYIKNYMQLEFYLKSLTLEDVPNHGTIHFVCNSWVYNSKLYNKRERIFFANKTYVPSETPAPLVKYREEELKTLRGDGTGERKEWERIYDYDVYNDLGNPDSSEKLVHPKCEKPGEVYVPRDENFGHLKSSDFLIYGIKSLSQYVLPAFQSVFDLNLTPNEFDSFQDVRDLYEGGIKLPLDVISTISPLPVIKELFRTDGEQVLKFPPPHIIQVSKSAWMTDEEFAREMLAGVNPCLIRSLQEFPPKSNLDPETYGNQTSKITAEALELDGCTLEEALAKQRLFILDYHDVFMPYLRRINQTSAKAYATRTILFLRDNGTLKPLAIELSLPHPDGDQSGAVSKVILPAKEGVESTIWLLAKAYVVVNDSCYHQLMSHWLNTHAVVEPFVIATNRNLSVLHPIHKLLHPHYRDTMNINALARQSLINADEDYPYATDGLEIWAAIKSWVHDYVSLYYATDYDVKSDSELQNWWKEVVEVGHGDLKDKPWWPKMQTLEELIETCTIIIWTASALHAAVNFGQYPYGGFILNRPTTSRRLLPEQGTEEYDEMVKSHQKAFLKTITPKYQTLVDLSVIEILSRHASDEVYLGERDNPYWTSDSRALQAFQKFGNKLKQIEASFAQKNKDASFGNRVGPVELPYTLLHPTGEEGLAFRGIPNSISI
ncbi:unnamed protein product [Lupinus luteus]|uniref:Lipoxygenase n=1 Tax=Lupinus luteus TaxID=3873 RepID=A0AAV1YF49_LUPLU